MMEIDVCTIHNCRLMESTVKISGTASPSLITASEEFGGEISQEEEPVSGRELTLAKYGYRYL